MRIGVDQGGKVTLGPDGKLDPAKASREVIENTDPMKLRARVFKQATASYDELRQRIRTLEAELAEERDYGERREKAAGFRAEHDAAGNLFRFTRALEARFDEAVAVRAVGKLHAWLGELECVEFYEQDLEEYRREMAEGDDTDDDADVPDADAAPIVRSDALGVALR